MSHEALLIALGAAAAFGESILGAGIVLPGEIVITGLATQLDPAARVALLTTVTLGATAGDHLNYWLGRSVGPRLRSSRVVEHIGHRHWDSAVRLVQRHGAWAVIGSRLVPVVRTLMAAVAGASRMDYPRFAVASLVGSVLWAAVWIAIGDVLRGLLQRPQAWLVILAGCVAGGWLLRRLRLTRTARVGSGLRE